MTPSNVRAASRRRFLQYLAASPLLSATGMPALANEALSKWPDPMIWTNPGSEPCVVAFVLVAAKPVERAGKVLGATG